MKVEQEPSEHKDSKGSSHTERSPMGTGPGWSTGPLQGATPSDYGSDFKGGEGVLSE